MKVTIRIHRQHDMDLMSIYRNKSYHLAKEFKKALVAYALGLPYCPPEVDFENKIDGYVPTSATLHVNLSEENESDKAAIELLSHIKHGYRCSFIKAVFRSSCLYLPLIAYSDDSGFVMRRTKIRVESQIDKMLEEAKTEPKQAEVSVAETSVMEEPKAEIPVAETFASQVAPVIKEEPKVIIPDPVSEAEDTSSEEDLDALFAKMDQLR